METISGKRILHVDETAFKAWLGQSTQVWMDIGTGDGQFVVRSARQHPGIAVIGVDTCRVNLIGASRRAPGNALFVIANAYSLPSELAGLASRLTIHFPWGSLLEGILAEDERLLASLRGVTRPGALVEVHLNESALVESGWALQSGGEQAHRVFAKAGLRVKMVTALSANDLRRCPTTWAKRQAFGRKPAAVYLSGSWS